jgi:hypothetical protein
MLRTDLLAQNGEAHACGLGSFKAGSVVGLKTKAVHADRFWKTMHALLISAVTKLTRAVHVSTLHRGEEESFSFQGVVVR